MNLPPYLPQDIKIFCLDKFRENWPDLIIMAIMSTEKINIDYLIIPLFFGNSGPLCCVYHIKEIRFVQLEIQFNGFIHKIII